MTGRAGSRRRTTSKTATPVKGEATGLQVTTIARLPGVGEGHSPRIGLIGTAGRITRIDAGPQTATATGRLGPTGATSNTALTGGTAASTALQDMASTEATGAMEATGTMTVPVGSPMGGSGAQRRIPIDRTELMAPSGSRPRSCMRHALSPWACATDTGAGTAGLVWIAP